MVLTKMEIFSEKSLYNGDKIMTVSIGNHGSDTRFQPQNSYQENESYFIQLGNTINLVFHDRIKLCGRVTKISWNLIAIQLGATIISPVLLFYSLIFRFSINKF